jgi:hypothetical protein
MEPEASLPCSQEPVTDPILSQINLVHILAHYVLKIHSDIILPPTPTKKSFFLSLACYKVNWEHTHVIVAME